MAHEPLEKRAVLGSHQFLHRRRVGEGKRHLVLGGPRHVELAGPPVTRPQPDHPGQIGLDELPQRAVHP